LASTILITGRPGVGKTTVMKKVIAGLRDRGWTVGGMITSEIRQSGRRIGFQVIDLISGETGILAHIELKKGPRVGRYHVNIEDLERIGVQAIQRALQIAEIVCCDEIAPMELSSPRFREAVKAVLSSGRPFLATVHRSAGGSLIEELRGDSDVTFITVTLHNRERIPQEIVTSIEKSLL